VFESFSQKVIPFPFCKRAIISREVERLGFVWKKRRYEGQSCNVRGVEAFRRTIVR
jgi:hypothetical protein